MRRIVLTFALVLLCGACFAQDIEVSYEGLEPGIYAVIDGQAVAMKHEIASVSSWDSAFH